MTDIYLNKNLRILREKKGISKEELGRRVGVSGVTIGYWETGKTVPRMGKVERIAQLLGVTTDELLFSNPETNEVDVVVDSLDKDVTPEQKRAIELILDLSPEDLKMFTLLMERSKNDEC